jgi:DNA-binding Lrp family transcriptional regulator
MIPVDAFDLKILSALQDDGRLTNQQLADTVGLSASQCSRRRMRLEQDKVISGYHADLAGEALGFGVIAFIHITLATHSPDNAKKFRALVGRVDDIQEAYSLTGDAECALLDCAGPLEGELKTAAQGAGAITLILFSSFRGAALRRARNP